MDRLAIRNDHDAGSSVRLSCPSCGGRLKNEIGDTGTSSESYGILSCGCARYPVVSGIPILIAGQVPGSSTTTEEVCQRILAGDERTALYDLLLRPTRKTRTNTRQLLDFVPGIPGKTRRRWQTLRDRKAWHREARRLLYEQRAETTACDMFSAYFGEETESSRNTCHYFSYRFAQPRYLTTLAMTAMIDPQGGPVLDLGCGSGHVTHQLQSIDPEQIVVGVDKSYFMLYVAKNWMAKDALYVLCDAETRLPFDDNVFESVLCSNTFHFLSDMDSCASELRRIAIPDGIFLLTAVRNALQPHSTPNNALSPRQYAELWGDLSVAMLPDDMILRQYLEGKSPDLSTSANWESLEHAPLISLVASADDRPFHPGEPFSSWPHARGRLRINPLYRVERRPAGDLLLTLAEPSRFFADENVEANAYLPEDVTVSAQAVADLEDGTTSDEVRELVEKCVFVGMPTGYARAIEVLPPHVTQPLDRGAGRELR
jgi:SAM-dependent methyltransferase